jgi:RHS repeat-associated protein
VGVLLRSSLSVGGSFPVIGKFARFFSNHWKLLLLPFFLLLSIEAQAFICTGLHDSIEFTSDAPTTFEGGPEPGNPYWRYTAEMTPGDMVTIDVTAPGNTNPDNSGCAFWQRYLLVGHSTCYYGANESFSCGGGMIYFPRKGQPHLPIYYGCSVLSCPPDGHDGQGGTIMAKINAAPPIQYSPGFHPDLRGDPDESYSASEPPTGNGPGAPGPGSGDGKPPPDGPNRCSPMGLPGFRINMATLNLFLQDCDFAYSTVGPRIDFTRTYNTTPYKSGIFGLCWTFPYEGQLWAWREYAVHTDTDGAMRLYAVPGSALASGGEYDPAWDGFYDSMTGDHRKLRVHNLTNGLPVYFTLWNRSIGLSSVFTSTVTAVDLAANHRAFCRLDAVRDDNSNEVRVTRNEMEMVSSVTDAAGRTTVFQYSPLGVCTQMVAPDGRTATYSYSNTVEGMVLTQSVDFVGNRTSFKHAIASWMPFGHISMASLAVTSMTTAGKTWAFSYTVNGTIASVTDPNGTTNYYDMPGPDITNRLTSRYDPKRGSTQYGSDAGRTVHVVDPMWNETFIFYSNNLPVQRIDPHMQVRNMAYDSRGNLVRLSREDGSVWSAGYDEDSRLTAATNSLGHVVNRQFDSRGNLITRNSPAGRTVTADYDARGLTARVDLPGGREYEYKRDSYGNITNILNPAGGTWTAVYDAHGFHPAMIVDPSGMPTALSYDDNNRLTSVTYADGRQRRIEYDCCAWSAVVNERGYTNRVERNARQFITRRTDPLGRQVNYSYDDRNNLLRVTYPDGTSDRYGYDVLDRMVSVTNRNGTVLSITNDALGRITALANEREGLYLFEYDPVGRLTRIQYPNWEWAVPPSPWRLSVVDFQYDRIGRLTNQVTWGNPYVGEKRWVSFAYDVDGIVTAKYHNGTSAASYSYDAGGAMVAYSDALGTTCWQRDVMLRVTNIVYPDGLSAAFGYNIAGYQTSASYPGGPVVTYSRDLRHRITSMTWDGQSIQFQLDAAGNVTNEIRSNGTDSYRVYDAAGQLTQLRHRTGTNVLVQLRYDRDTMGRTTNIVKESGILAIAPVFGPATNRARYDIGDELTNWNGTAVHHDWRGGMVTNMPGRGFSAEYDAEARVVSMTAGGTNASHAYDGLGRRVRSTLNGRTKNYHHDDAGRILFETEEGEVMARYFWRGPALVAMWRQGKGYFFYHHDKLGNTMAMTDGAGKLAAIYRYTAYGLVASAFARVENPFTYVGRYGVMDEGGGIFFMQNRYYDSVAGRFLTRDPIGLAGGLNMYSYVGGNPADRTDPSGLLWREIAHVVNVVAGDRQRMDPAFQGVLHQIRESFPVNPNTVRQWNDRLVDAWADADQRMRDLEGVRSTWTDAQKDEYWEEHARMYTAEQIAKVLTEVWLSPVGPLDLSDSAMQIAGGLSVNTPPHVPIEEHIRIFEELRDCVP